MVPRIGSNEGDKKKEGRKKLDFSRLFSRKDDLPPQTSTAVADNDSKPALLHSSTLARLPGDGEEKDLQHESVQIGVADGDGRKSSEHPSLEINDGTWNNLWISSNDLQLKDIALSLWERAYKLLKSDEPDLVTAYERVFDEQLLAVRRGVERDDLDDLEVPWNDARLVLTTKIAAEMTRATEGIIDKEKAASDSKTRHALQSTASAVSILNGLSPLLQAYPAAAAAWGVIAGIVPTLIKPITNRKLMAEGLSHVIKQLDRQQIASKALLRRNWQTDQDYARLRLEMANQIVDLFQMLLKYQIQAVCRVYASNPFVVGLQDIINREDWISSDLESIKNTENDLWKDKEQYLVHSIARDIDSLKERARYETSDEENILIGKFKTTGYDWIQRATEKLPDPVEGTCSWFLHLEKFQDWLKATDSARIFVVAEPGCGKSVLARHLTMNSIPLSNSDTIICYYFFTDTTEERSGCAAICALLHQLFKQRPRIIADIRGKILKEGARIVSNTSALKAIWKAATEHSEARNICIVIDALNQCNPNDLTFFLETITSPLSSKAKILITTRGRMPIETSLAEHGFNNRILLSGEDSEDEDHIQAEIVLVVEQKIQNLSKKWRWGPEREDRIREMLREKGLDQRTYLWVDIIFKLLEDNDEDRDSEWKTLINNLPEGVAAAYEKLLGNVKPNKKRTVRTLLELMVAAKRPLSLREMNTALFILDEGKNGGTVELEDEISKINTDEGFESWVKSQCNFLVIVYDGKLDLLHPTAYEWLRGDMAPADWDHKKSDWRYSISISAAERTMTGRCLSYLSLRDFEQYARPRMLTRPNDRKIRAICEKHGFLEYAAAHWVSHFKTVLAVRNEIDAPLKEQAHGILGFESGKFLPWYWIHSSDLDELDYAYDPGQTFLMSTVNLELDIPVSALLEGKDEELNKQSPWGRSVVHYAVLHCRLSLLKELLDRKAKGMLQDKDLRTPLHVAVQLQQHKAVEMLVAICCPRELNLKDVFDLTARDLAFLLQGSEIMKTFRLLDSDTPLGWGLPEFGPIDAQAIKPGNPSALGPEYTRDSDFDLRRTAERYLTNIRAELLRTVWGGHFTMHDYMAIYTLVFTYDVLCDIDTGGPVLYQLLKDLMVAYVTRVKDGARHMEMQGRNEDLEGKLRFLNREYSRYIRSTEAIALSCRSLTRHYIKRQHDEGNENVLPIKILFVKIWAEELGDGLRDLLIDRHPQKRGYQSEMDEALWEKGERILDVIQYVVENDDADDLLQNLPARLNI